MKFVPSLLSQCGPFLRYTGLGYAATVCITMAAYRLFGFDAVPISMLFQLLLVNLCSILLNTLCFSPRWLGRMRYTRRMALFMVLLFGVIAGFALVCGWFPAERWESWLIFTAIFLVGGGLMTLGFELYFRASGNRYDDLLNEYRKKRGEPESSSGGPA